MDLNYVIVLSAILLFPFLYETSAHFRFRLRILIYYLSASVFAVLLIPFFLFRPHRVENMVIGAKLMSQVSKFIGLRWNVKGNKEALLNDVSFFKHPKF